LKKKVAKSLENRKGVTTFAVPKRGGVVRDRVFHTEGNEKSLKKKVAKSLENRKGVTTFAVPKRGM
jgi:hypothetical protein